MTLLNSAEEKTYLGPFIKVDKDEESKIYAFRPLFYYESNYELKFKSLDIIYPLIGYSEDSQQTQFNALFRLIKYSNYSTYDDTNKKTFEIFPIVDIACLLYTSPSPRDS